MSKVDDLKAELKELRKEEKEEEEKADLEKKIAAIKAKKTLTGRFLNWIDENIDTGGNK